MDDRRQPLGGISRETFVNPKSDTHERELLFDVLSCIDSKIQHNAGQISEINSKCPNDCLTMFDKRYIRKVWEKLPVSKVELIAYLLFIGVLIGLGMIEFNAIAKWLPK
jgi:hypothetical protein